MAPKHRTVFDQVIRGHPIPRRRTRIPYVQPGGDLPPRSRLAMNDSGDAPRLVGRECVHRVDEDRLDASPASLLAAVIEYRVEEALRLAGPGTGGDDRRAPRIQPFEG